MITVVVTSELILTVLKFFETEDQWSVAPGEGNKPLSIFKDEHSEELAYHGTFLGQKRPENKKTCQCSL